MTDEHKRAPIRISASEARTAPIPAGARSALLLKHGSMKLRYYQPRGIDPQTPHTQDEVYVVTKGRGEFVYNEARERFECGDVLFARANATHRFENFSDDLELWVIFYGPDGGEAP